MSLFQRPNSPYWWYEFQCGGQRFRGTTGRTVKREAEKVERDERERAAQHASVARIVANPNVSVRMEDAALRYYLEIKNQLSEDRNVLRDLEWLVKFFGVSMPITDISDDDVKRLVARRREDQVVRRLADKSGTAKRPVRPQTINHTIVRLQAMISHAKEKWRIKFPNEPIWKKHKLKVEKRAARIFVDDEKPRFDAAIREDYRPILAFAHESGKRRAYCYDLRWPDVHWTREVIQKPGKRKPNGEEKIEYVQITPEIRAILEPLKGHHPEFVFTYVAQRTRDGRKRGHRYPIVESNIATRFDRICEKAKIDDFGFHSLRRSAATEFYDATGKDLLATQRFLGHSDSKTTEKYILRNDENVRAGMESRAKLRAKTELAQEVPTQGPHTKDEEAA